jgi:hypothetical protein
MTRLFAHLRHNTVGYLALFVALGGTSYAAISIPAGSVGTRALRNGAVTGKKLANGSIDPSKFDKAIIAGSIRAWVAVGPTGAVAASSEPVSEVQWSQGGPAGYGGFLVFAHPFSSNRHTGCLAMGANLGPGGGLTVEAGSAPGTATVDSVHVNTYFAGGSPFTFGFWVMVVCGT